MQLRILYRLIQESVLGAGSAKQLIQSGIVEDF
jgi:hypothetical protein